MYNNVIHRYVICYRGRKGNLADAGNLADSNISETINDTKKNSINNL